MAWLLAAEESEASRRDPVREKALVCFLFLIHSTGVPFAAIHLRLWYREGDCALKVPKERLG